MPSNRRHRKHHESLTGRRNEEAIAKAWERAKADSAKFEEMGIGKTSLPEKPSSAQELASKGESASKAGKGKAGGKEKTAGSKAEAKSSGFEPYRPEPAKKDDAARSGASSSKGKKKAGKAAHTAPKAGAKATKPAKVYTKDPELNAKVAKAKAGNASKPKKKRSKKRIAAIVGACFCGILLCGFGAVALALNMGRANLVEQGDVDVNENAVSYDNGQTVEYNGVKYKRKQNMTSILLLGHDGRDGQNLNGQTDLVMVLAVDTDSGKMDIISIPRDTMVDIRRNYNKSDVYADTATMQIAAAFAYGSDFEHSAENVCDAVSSLIYNIPMSYYYVLNVNGVAPLTDAVGGVEVQALMNVPPAGIVEGQTYNLMGKNAYYYVQYRNIYESGSAFGRLDRQKQFLNAYAKKVFDEAKGNVGVIVDIFNTVAEYSTTNIGIPEFTYLASIFLNHGIDDFEITTLQGEYVHNDDTNHAEFYLDRDSVYQTVLDVYYEPLEEAQKAEERAEEERSIDYVSDVSF